MKNSVLSLAIPALLLSHVAQAQSPGEISCRAKAKQAAVEIYSGCMTEYRTNKIDEIRSNYKKDLQQLKSKYDNQLNDLSGGRSNSSPEPESAPEGANSQPMDSDSIEMMAQARSGGTVPNSAKSLKGHEVGRKKAQSMRTSIASQSPSLATRQAPVAMKVVPLEMENAPIEFHDNPIDTP